MVISSFVYLSEPSLVLSSSIGVNLVAMRTSLPYLSLCFLANHIIAVENNAR
jgi:hypothetical protein